MNCLYCNKKLGLFASRKKRFCSEHHEVAYNDEQAGIALRRVMDPLFSAPVQRLPLQAHAANIDQGSPAAELAEAAEAAEETTITAAPGVAAGDLERHLPRQVEAPNHETVPPAASFLAQPRPGPHLPESEVRFKPFGFEAASTDTRLPEDPAGLIPASEIPLIEFEDESEDDGEDASPEALASEVIAETAAAPEPAEQMESAEQPQPTEQPQPAEQLEPAGLEQAAPEPSLPEAATPEAAVPEAAELDSTAVETGSLETGVPASSRLHPALEQVKPDSREPDPEQAVHGASGSRTTPVVFGTEPQSLALDWPLSPPEPDGIADDIAEPDTAPQAGLLPNAVERPQAADCHQSPPLDGNAPDEPQLAVRYPFPGLAHGNPRLEDTSRIAARWGVAPFAGPDSSSAVLALRNIVAEPRVSGSSVLSAAEHKLDSARSRAVEPAAAPETATAWMAVSDLLEIIASLRLPCPATERNLCLSNAPGIPATWDVSGQADAWRSPELQIREIVLAVNPPAWREPPVEQLATSTRSAPRLAIAWDLPQQAAGWWSPEPQIRGSAFAANPPAWTESRLHQLASLAASSPSIPASWNLPDCPAERPTLNLELREQVFRADAPSLADLPGIARILTPGTVKIAATWDGLHCPPTRRSPEPDAGGRVFSVDLPAWKESRGFPRLSSGTTNPQVWPTARPDSAPIRIEDATALGLNSALKCVALPSLLHTTAAQFTLFPLEAPRVTAKWEPVGHPASGPRPEPETGERGFAASLPAWNASTAPVGLPSSRMQRQEWTPEQSSPETIKTKGPSALDRTGWTRRVAFLVEPPAAPRTGFPCSEPHITATWNVSHPAPPQWRPWSEINTQTFAPAPPLWRESLNLARLCSSEARPQTWSFQDLPAAQWQTEAANAFARVSLPQITAPPVEGRVPAGQFTSLTRSAQNDRNDGYRPSMLLGGLNGFRKTRAASLIQIPELELRSSPHSDLPAPSTRLAWSGIPPSPEGRKAGLAVPLCPDVRAPKWAA